MNGLPYYKRYPRDFIEGTIGMPFELKSTYSVILDLIYMQGGHLPDEPRYIAGHLGCSVRKWNALREGLLGLGKIHASEGYLTNDRADTELESLAKLQDKQRENRSRPNKNKEIQSPRFDHTEPEPLETGKPVSKRKNGSRLPADWRLPRDWGVWAVEQGLPDAAVRVEADKFRDYWLAKTGSGATKLDWLATWRNWVRTALANNPRRYVEPDQKLDAWGIPDAKPVRVEPRVEDRPSEEATGAADLPRVQFLQEGSEPEGPVSFGDPDRGWIGDPLPPLRALSGCLV